ncbi:MAG: hypothetical protein A3J48_02565 [Candidatus Doudnabacteria bacterium RIFCSPHIGHO2_02_FULL_46_11]|uniref:DprA winged helix domain-containing protein n=1 Tax=Candidatus Doudnabacteria bacterium RIFCSPHIGHO2_02_FULL_46_11 TaxID=1817832 RepID=A0A1F5P8V0_9BACT|nr:MAG: hypothetical protein A3J48_02565 [Candidatus Doudnabacteria bacterium RIFCSPHIGHO2_02_FULL_46_11]
MTDQTRTDAEWLINDPDALRILKAIPLEDGAHLADIMQDTGFNQAQVLIACSRMQDRDFLELMIESGYVYKPTERAVRALAGRKTIRSATHQAKPVPAA